MYRLVLQSLITFLLVEVAVAAVTRFLVVVVVGDHDRALLVLKDELSLQKQDV